MANYTKEIRNMMEKVGLFILGEDKLGFYKSALGEGYSMMDIYLILFVAGGERSLGDVVRHFGISRNMVNSAVDGLVKRDVLKKGMGESDARQRVLSLTQKGALIYEKLVRERNREIEFMLEEATINEEKAILKFLSKYTQFRIKKPKAEDFKASDRD